MNWITKNSAYIAWAIALISTLGSLYFSEIVDLTPCLLCWYQRTMMYPLVIVIAVGILRKDKGMWAYALPLSIIGGLLALYHNFLQWGVMAEQFAPCVGGVSCVTKHVVALKVITIPVLSLAAFILIAALMLINRSRQNNE